MSTHEITVIRPDDAGYDEHRLGFQRHRQQRPAGIVAAHSADDVAAAVRFARSEGRRVAVQATGHGVATVDPDALLVDTSALRGVSVDPVARTARAEAGARWGDVISAAAPHGLAPLSGSTPAVGVVGYLLAGGVPLLARAHGFAAAGVRSFEVVTASGERRTVRAGTDLDWALRGGGGSFALVTAVTVELIELRTVYGGSLTLPSSPEHVRAWRDWAAAAPEEVGTALAVLPGGAASVRVVIDAPAAMGERLVAPLRDLGATDVRLRELPWTRSGEIWSDPTGPLTSRNTNVALRDLPDFAVDAALATARAEDVMRIPELRRLGGALTRPTGLPTRTDVQWTVGVVSVMAPEPLDDAAIAHDTRLRAALAPVTAGRLASFLFGDGADPDAVRSAYDDATWERLRSVRRDVDPDDVFVAGAPIPS